MTAGFVVTSIVQIVLGTAVPALAATMLARRTRARWRSFWLGALVFGGSQVVHVPLNALLGWALNDSVGALERGPRVAISMAILGLSAGVCEETARWIFFRRATEHRGRDDGLMVGLGHGGIESIFFGSLMALWGVAQISYLERAGGPEAVGLSGDEAAMATMLIDVAHDAWWLPLVAAAERLFVMPFHVAMAMLVLWGVLRERRWAWPAAIGCHAILDGVSGWLAASEAPMRSELFLLATVPLSALAIVIVHRALPPQDAPDDPATRAREPAGAPLELFRATKRYGATLALDDATIVLEPGSRTCLLGPNGAGKTTTIRLALGALVPSAGRVWLFSAEHGSRELVSAKRRTGVVPQQPGMYEDLTVREYLEMVRALYGRGRIDDVAAELGITPLLARPMAKNSGGQQRRIALAAALLPEPDLLVLDEPSAGLDPIAQKAMRETLERIGRGRTVLLCTHDLDEADALCERVVVMEKGRVKVHERIDVLRSRRPTRLRLVAVQPPAEVLSALAAAAVPGAAEGEGAVLVPIPEGRARVPAILRGLLSAGIDVEECVVEEASLEEIFLAAVERASLPPDEPPSAAEGATP